MRCYSIKQMKTLNEKEVMAFTVKLYLEALLPAALGSKLADTGHDAKALRSV